MWALSLGLSLFGARAQAGETSAEPDACEAAAAEGFSTLGAWAGADAYATLMKDAWGNQKKSLDELWAKHKDGAPTPEAQIDFIVEILALSRSAGDGATNLVHGILETLPLEALQNKRLEDAIAAPYPPDYKGYGSPKLGLTWLLVRRDPSNSWPVDALFSSIESAGASLSLGHAHFLRRSLLTLLKAGFQFQREDIFKRFFAIVDQQFASPKAPLRELSELLFEACKDIDDSPFMQQQLGNYVQRVYARPDRQFHAQFHDRLFTAFFFLGNERIAPYFDEALTRLHAYKLDDFAGTYMSDLNWELDRLTGAIHSYTFHKMLNNPQRDGYERHFLPALTPVRARRVLDLYAKVLEGADLNAGLDSLGKKIGFPHLIPSALHYLESRLTGVDPRRSWDPRPHYLDFIAHVGIPSRPELGIRWPAWVIRGANP